MDDQLLTPFSKRRIARLAQAALESAGAVGTLPTPIEDVQRAVGIRERIDIAELPSDLLAQKPKAWDRVLGAALLTERIVFVDTSEPGPRQLFTEAHETGHLMCEWHEAALMLDGEETLFRAAQDRVEAEANYAASCLIFQGASIGARAVHEEPSIAVPLALASEYGASRHATLRFYVDEHPAAMALLVAGRYPSGNGSLPIWHTVESPAFLARFGRLTAHLPAGQLSACAVDGDPLGEIVAESRGASEPPRARLALHEPATGGRARFRAEAFFNGRCHFVLLCEHPASAMRGGVELQRAGDQ